MNARQRAVVVLGLLLAVLVGLFPPWKYKDPRAVTRERPGAWCFLFAPPSYLEPLEDLPRIGPPSGKPVPKDFEDLKALILFKMNERRQRIFLPQGFGVRPNGVESVVLDVPRLLGVWAVVGLLTAAVGALAVGYPRGATRREGSMGLENRRGRGLINTPFSAVIATTVHRLTCGEYST